LIKKVWAKFNDMDLTCVCDEHHRKCKDDTCKEYVVRFTEIKRDKQIDDVVTHIKQESSNLRRDIKKFQSEISRSIKKFRS